GLDLFLGGGGPGRLAQMAGFDDRRVSVAVLPTSLDLDLVGLPEEAEDDVVARPAVLDRCDRRLARGKRQQRDDLAEMLTELLAQVFGRAFDVAGDQRAAERLGASA